MSLIENLGLAAEALSFSFYCLIHGNGYNQLIEEHVKRIESGGHPENDARIDKLPSILRGYVLGKISLAFAEQIVNQDLQGIEEIRSNLDSQRLELAEIKGELAEVHLGLDGWKERTDILHDEFTDIQDRVAEVRRDIWIVENEPKISQSN